jgi:hypothetical protein
MTSTGIEPDIKRVLCTSHYSFLPEIFLALTKTSRAVMCIDAEKYPVSVSSARCVYLLADVGRIRLRKI